jgi:hypothetical protein
MEPTPSTPPDPVFSFRVVSKRQYGIGSMPLVTTALLSPVVSKRQYGIG